MWEVIFDTNTGAPDTNGQLEQMQVAVVMDDGSVGPFDFEVRLIKFTFSRSCFYVGLEI